MHGFHEPGGDASGEDGALYGDLQLVRKAWSLG